MQKTKRVFKKSLAIKLMEMGCSLVKVEPNKYNPSLEVYSFIVNGLLDNALIKLTHSKVFHKCSNNK